jgi:hypothetical protein
VPPTGSARRSASPRPGAGRTTREKTPAHLAADAVRRRRRACLGRRRRCALRPCGRSGRDDPVGVGGQPGHRAAAISSRGSRRSSLDVRDASLADTSGCRTPAVRGVTHGTGSRCDAALPRRRTCSQNPRPGVRHCDERVTNDPLLAQRGSRSRAACHQPRPCVRPASQWINKPAGPEKAGSPR